MAYALDAAKRLADEGIEAELIDLRTLRPLDIETVLASVRKTNRIVTVEEGWSVCSIGTEICARVAAEAFDHLDAPPIEDHRRRRADALCRQSREARAALGRQGRRRGEIGLLPGVMRDMAEAPMSWKKGGCHCGAVRFEVLAPDEIEATECTCSICRKSGYLHLIVPARALSAARGRRQAHHL